jgi:hypothetical protein
VLLAACRPSEYAYEYTFEGTQRNGALTYWLLDSLEDLGPGLSYKQLHDRILAKVHSQFETQTPLLQGEGDREVFGSKRVPPVYAVPVMKVDQPNRRVLLQTGQVHAIRKGTMFAVYPLGATNLRDKNNRQALVEVSEVRATDSWAAIKNKFRSAPIEQGAPAVLVGAGSVKLVRKIGLVRRGDLPPSIDQEAALCAVERMVQENGWVEVATNGEQIAYQVALNRRGEYEIWDPSGRPVANLRPSIAACENNAANRVAQRLAHLARYQAVRHLSNYDALSSLARKLLVELLGKQAHYVAGERPEAMAFDPANPNTLEVGEWTFLRIQNRSSQVLNITVLDLTPAWGISQIYPSGPADYFVPLDPGEYRDLPLEAHLPEGYQHGADIIKVFGTVGATNFRWLELPNLDQPLLRSGAMRGQVNPLEELLAAIAAERPLSRDLTVSGRPSEEWVTAQVEVRLRRA